MSDDGTGGGGSTDTRRQSCRLALLFGFATAVLLTAWFLLAENFIDRRHPVGGIMTLYVVPLCALAIVSLLLNALLWWRRERAQRERRRHLVLVEMERAGSIDVEAPSTQGLGLLAADSLRHDPTTE